MLVAALAAPPAAFPPLVSQVMSHICKVSRRNFPEARARERTQPGLHAHLSRTNPPPEQQFVKFQGTKPLDSVRLPPRRMWRVSTLLFASAPAQTPTPYTLHPTPYTLHPVPCTLTLNHAPHTMQPGTLNLNPIPKPLNLVP